MSNPLIHVIGAGLAGSEAAWQIAQRGVNVKLFEMRPSKMTPAHHSGNFAELVCSNSFRAAQLESGAGLLKEELRLAGSLIMTCADACRLPAGGALAVDREAFSAMVTEKIRNHPLIEVVEEEVLSLLPGQPTVIATGPLTSDGFFAYLQQLTGSDTLYFYDAAAPIIAADSVDCNIAYWASRYDKGDADYLNCPMTKEEYDRFYQALMAAEWVKTKDFEKEIFFEGCMPVEVMAARGYQTLTFGPLKPVGLPNPHTGEEPYAVVQLRKDDAAGSLLNIVGFQTRMVWGDQKRIIALIPGLAEAEIVRYGVMHRNTFLNSPLLLEATGALKNHPGVFVAGQMTGVEGYLESCAGGLVAGINAARLALAQEAVTFPAETAIGSLLRYITQADHRHFQPMNINFGLLPPLTERIRQKKEKNKKIAERSIAQLEGFLQQEKV